VNAQRWGGVLVLYRGSAECFFNFNFVSFLSPLRPPRCFLHCITVPSCTFATISKLHTKTWQACDVNGTREFIRTPGLWIDSWCSGYSGIWFFPQAFKEVIDFMAKVAFLVVLGCTVLRHVPDEDRNCSGGRVLHHYLRLRIPELEALLFYYRETGNYHFSICS